MLFRSIILKQIFLLCSVLPFSFEKELFLPNCNLDFVSEKFLLNGQIFQVRWYGEQITLTACRNDTVMEKLTEFDLERIKANTKIQFYGMHLPPLPELQAKSIFMIGSSVSGDWKCSQLTDLHIQKPNVTGISPTWLRKCVNLHKIILEQFHIREVGLVIDATDILQELELIDVKDFENVLEKKLFPTERCVWLESGDPKGKDQLIKRLVIKNKNQRLDNNLIWDDISSSLAGQISRLSRLESLIIQDVQPFDLCARRSSIIVNFPSLKYLEISATNTSRLCFKELRNSPKLSELKLRKVPVNVVEFGELLSIQAQTLNVNFEEVKIETFLFNYRDYFTLTNGTATGQVRMRAEFSIDCSCDKALWLRRALTEELLIVLGINCFYQTSHAEGDCEWSKCKKVPCDNNCVCCEDKPGTFIADCRYTERNDWPKALLSQTNITQMLIRNNYLTTLPGVLPESLLLLDVSNNDVLRKWTAEDLNALFNGRDRRTRLAGNPIVCNCENRALIITLLEHRDQIEDFENITCVDSDVKIANVDVSSLCAAENREKAKLTAISVALVAAAAALIFGVGLYYRRSIQIFLFARGWCLCCVREEELDADRRYDIFLSFCHADTEIVKNNILPILDKEYSVCVHIRDFIPGEMIPTQINNCIAQSRRTIIVLSKSFIKSLWGIFEFRTAHMSGLMEGRVRVVMIVLDDVLETTGLEGEVKSYVKLNTYVKWGDPWFWEKLRYALPHRPNPHVPEQKPYNTRSYVPSLMQIRAED